MNDINKMNGLLGVTASMITGKKTQLGIEIDQVYTVECFDKDGNFKWRDTIKNLVVTTGRNAMLEQFYKGSAYTAAHYVGLTDGTPTVVAGDTMASHDGWVEVEDYDNIAVRADLTMGTVSAGSVNNAGAVATFTIDANSTTIGGCFITTDDTRGGTSGILIGGGAFTAGDKVLDDDDVLNVTVTAAITSS